MLIMLFNAFCFGLMLSSLQAKFYKNSDEYYVLQYFEDQKVKPVRIEFNEEQQLEHIRGPNGEETLFDFRERKVVFKDKNSSQCFVMDIGRETMEEDRRMVKELTGGVIRASFIPTFILEEHSMNSNRLIGFRITSFCEEYSIIGLQEHEGHKGRRKRDTSEERGNFKHYSYGHYGHQSTNYAHYGHESSVTGTVDKDGNLQNGQIRQQQFRSESSGVRPEQGYANLHRAPASGPATGFTSRDQDFRSFGHGLGTDRQFSMQTNQESGYQLNLPLGRNSGSTYRTGVQTRHQYGSDRRPQMFTEHTGREDPFRAGLLAGFGSGEAGHPAPPWRTPGLQFQGTDQAIHRTQSDLSNQDRRLQDVPLVVRSGGPYFEKGAPQTTVRSHSTTVYDAFGQQPPSPLRNGYVPGYIPSQTGFPPPGLHRTRPVGTVPGIISPQVPGTDQFGSLPGGVSHQASRTHPASLTPGIPVVSPPVHSRHPSGLRPGIAPPQAPTTHSSSSTPEMVSSQVSGVHPSNLMPGMVPLQVQGAHPSTLVPAAVAPQAPGTRPSSLVPVMVSPQDPGTYPSSLIPGIISPPVHPSALAGEIAPRTNGALPPTVSTGRISRTITGTTDSSTSASAQREASETRFRLESRGGGQYPVAEGYDRRYPTSRANEVQQRVHSLPPEDRLRTSSSDHAEQDYFQPDVTRLKASDYLSDRSGTTSNDRLQKGYDESRRDFHPRSFPSPAQQGSQTPSESLLRGPSINVRTAAPYPSHYPEHDRRDFKLLQAGLGDSASSQTQVQTNADGTAAEAASAGRYGAIGSQVQVQGVYTGNGSFSAQAQSGFTGGGVQSNVQGNRQGGLSGSSAQVQRIGSAQSQVQVGQPSGVASSSAQGRFAGGVTQVQAQSSRSGGSAAAQSQSTGLSNSHVQVNIGGNNANTAEKFQGAVSASVQGGYTSGQSETQLQGGYDSGRTYAATAQGGFDTATGLQMPVPGQSHFSGKEEKFVPSQQNFQQPHAIEHPSPQQVPPGTYVPGTRHTKLSPGHKSFLTSPTRPEYQQLSVTQPRYPQPLPLLQTGWTDSHSIVPQPLAFQPGFQQLPPASVQPEFQQTQYPSQTPLTGIKPPSLQPQFQQNSISPPLSRSLPPSGGNGYPGTKDESSRAYLPSTELEYKTPQPTSTQRRHRVPSTYDGPQPAVQTPSQMWDESQSIYESREGYQLAPGQPGFQAPLDLRMRHRQQTSFVPPPQPTYKPSIPSTYDGYGASLTSSRSGYQTLPIPPAPGYQPPQHGYQSQLTSPSHMPPTAFTTPPSYQSPPLVSSIHTQHQTNPELPTGFGYPPVLQPPHYQPPLMPSLPHGYQPQPPLPQQQRFPSQGPSAYLPPPQQRIPTQISYENWPTLMPTPPQEHQPPPQRTHIQKPDDIRRARPPPASPELRSSPLPPATSHPSNITDSSKIPPRVQPEASTPGIAEPGESDCCETLRNLRMRCCQRSSGTEQQSSACCRSKESRGTSDLKNGSDRSESEGPCKVVKAICYIVYKPAGKARICKPTSTNQC